MNDIDSQETIWDLKEKIEKLPIRYPNLKTEEFEHFRDFFNTYKKFRDAEEKGELDSHFKEIAIQSMERYHYHLEMLWNHILKEFTNPIWCCDDKGLNKTLCDKYTTGSGKINTTQVKSLITEAINKHELGGFFVAFPYVKNLLIIDKHLNNPNGNHIFEDIVTDYLQTLQCYDRIFPLLVLREHVQFMLNNEDFDEVFYKKYMKGAEHCIKERGHIADLHISIFSLLIDQCISSKLRKSEGFKEFKSVWNALDGLYKNVKLVDKQQFQNNLSNLKIFFEQLLLLQLGKIDISNVVKVDVSNMFNVNLHMNVKPAQMIIEDYLEIIESITEDSEMSRLATLRAITAIGEAFNEIKEIFSLDERKTIFNIIKLRDYVIHSSTFDCFLYLNKLIKNMDDNTLPNVLLELQNLCRDFIIQTKHWSNASDRLTVKFPQISQNSISNITQFGNHYAEIRQKKDDRDSKLTIAESQFLLSTIPLEDKVDNPDYQRIEDFIAGKEYLDRREFVDACISYKNARKLHQKIKEVNAINVVWKALEQNKFEFDKLILNVSKFEKVKLDKLKRDKNVAGLKVFLDEHKRRNNFDKNEVLDSNKSIDLKPFKQILVNLLDETIQSQNEFEDNFNKAVKIIFKDNPQNQKDWHAAFEKFKNRKVVSIKQDQLLQLDFLLKNIEELKKNVRSVFRYTYVDTRANPVISIACEMLYGFCLTGFKDIKKNINLLYDYNDITLYYFINNHPLRNVKSFLESAIEMRDDMFHFDKLFKSAGGVSVECCREIWFSWIQHLTHGMFFSKAIAFSSLGVSDQAMFGESSLLQLIRFKEILKADLTKNTVNMYDINVAASLDSNTEPAVITLSTDPSSP